MRLKLDNRGRLTIPKIIKETLKLKNDSIVNIEFDETQIIITKPDEVDYKAIVEKALKYIDGVFKKIGYCIENDCEYHLDEEDLEEVGRILENEIKD